MKKSKSKRKGSRTQTQDKIANHIIQFNYLILILQILCKLNNCDDRYIHK